MYEEAKRGEEKTVKKYSYSVQEVMQLAGITRQTVYKLIGRGCFRSVKVYGRHRIIKSSFDKWLEG